MSDDTDDTGAAGTAPRRRQLDDDWRGDRASGYRSGGVPAVAPPRSPPAPAPADRRPAARATGDRGIGSRGTGDRGTGSRGIGDRGIGNRGIGDRGTENRGTGPRRSALSAPPRVDFPDTIVGEVPSLPVYVANLDPRYQAQIHVSLDDESVFHVRSKPAWLRSSAEPSAPIVVAFLPRGRAVSRARLRVSAVWQGNAHPAEEIVIELHGLAHRDGEPTHAEAAEAVRRESDARAAAAHRAKTSAALDRAHHDYVASPRSAPRDDLDTRLKFAYDDAKLQLEAISKAQLRGVVTAYDEAKAFRRALKPPRRSLAWELAILALDVVSAGLAGVVAGKLGRAFRKPERRPVDSKTIDKKGKPALDTKDFPDRVEKAPVRTSQKFLELEDEPEDFVTESVETLLKDSAKKVLDRSINTVEALGDETPEQAIYFFAMQHRLLDEQSGERSEGVKRLHYGLRPRLHGKDADSVIRAFETVVDGLTEVLANAEDMQRRRSRTVWLSFLSQGALGSVQATGGSLVSDTRGAHHTAPEGGQVTPIDGVIEAEIEADFAKPASPVKLLGLRCTGVTTESLRQLLASNGYRLRDIGVVVRVTGRAKGVAEFRVGVVQDEAGELRFTDNTAAAGTPSTWLTRKAGGWGANRQHAGARVLMDEVLDTVLGRDSGKAKTFSVPIWTDQN